MRWLEPQRDERRSGRWILASASPRRADLLERAGQRFDCEASAVEESLRAGEGAVEFAARLAHEKASDVSRRRPGRWVLAADTVVIVDGEPFGKPRDAAHARAMLARLSHRTHEVATAFVLLDCEGRTFATGVVRSEVVFRRLEPKDIDSYLQTGEPFDKAGGYAIQGGARAFVREVNGSFTNVVGLPMAEVEAALRAGGLWIEASAACER
jgi:nucleoside triphosphate pyrophosphatase